MSDEKLTVIRKRIIPNSFSRSFYEKSLLTNTLNIYIKVRDEENQMLILDGLNVQILKVVVTAYKRYFMNHDSGLSKMQGLMEFYSWEQPYRMYTKKAKNHYLPLKARIFKYIL
jgi:hypothetical protein